jgi:hypothetical protein
MKKADWTAEELFELLNPTVKAGFDTDKDIYRIEVEGKKTAYYFMSKIEFKKFIRRWNDSRAIAFKVEI